MCKAMRTIMINTGTELLLGDVLNTHLRFVAREIFPLGLRIERQMSVPDGAAIREALAESMSFDLVFVTGGLGPTTDDLTREAIAELLRTGIRGKRGDRKCNSPSPGESRLETDRSHSAPGARSERGGNFA